MKQSAYIQYKEIKFKPATLAVIDQANEIIEEYASQGYDLTLRQLYYQFVARDLIPNRQKEYDRLGGIINDGRLAGLIDWMAIEDRTRELDSNSHWDDPAHIIRIVSEQFMLDKWEDQDYRLEIWVEKEALAGVFERVGRELDIAWFSCRGYVSQSELWRAAMRLRGYEKGGQKPIVLHFGDHDPSGIDMTRDIEERLRMFGSRARVERLALNMDQIDEYQPPPNPAKVTDSRFVNYQAEHGDESWELDALEPTVLADMVREAVAKYRDDDLYAQAEQREEEGRKQLSLVSENWDEVAEYVENNFATDEDEDES
jgi:hypothetical protein